MKSVKIQFTVTLLLCILLPTALIGTAAIWFIFATIKENRIAGVEQIADSRYESLRTRLVENNQRSQDLLKSLITACRYSDEGINRCVSPKLEQFKTINHADGMHFHSKIESDIAVGTNPIAIKLLKLPLQPAQIAVTSNSKRNGTALFSLIATDSASGFSLVTTYSGQSLQDIFTNSPVLGQSGETFLADSHGFFITKPRYPTQQGATQLISATPMQHCLHKENSQLLDLDYRNVPIIHGFRFVPEIGGGCIMAHIDQKEAFAPLLHLITGLVIVASVFSYFAWLVAEILSKNMTTPLIALAQMAQALSRGDFSQRTLPTKYQEIADLSHLFNSMAGKLDNSLKQLKISESFNSSILNSLTVHIAVLDSLGIIIMVNRAWQQFALQNGLSENYNYMLGCNYLQVCSNSAEQADSTQVMDVIKGIQAVMSGTEQEFSLEYSCHSPTENRWFYMTVSLLQGEKNGVVISHEDITRRKQAEQAMREAELKAIRASQAKSDFLSSMSHELRTPMNAVLGYGQLLAFENLTEDQHDSVIEILTAGHHLLDLINQVLDLSKIESGKLALKLNKINLCTVVQNCLGLIQPLTLQNQIRIINNTANCHCLVLADLLHLKQVLLNLMSNAIKYNRVNGSVTVSCACIKAQTVRISITDTGNGLSAEQLAKLFQPFERLSAKNSNIEGTGIGLCISKKLIESMHGSIGVESIEGQGSCFWIEIPLVIE